MLLQRGTGDTFSPTFPPGSSSSPTLGARGSSGLCLCSSALNPSLLGSPLPCPWAGPTSAIPNSAPNGNYGQTALPEGAQPLLEQGKGDVPPPQTQPEWLFGVTQSHGALEQPVGRFQPPPRRAPHTSSPSSSLCCSCTASSGPGRGWKTSSE